MALIAHCPTGCGPLLQDEIGALVTLRCPQCGYEQLIHRLLSPRLLGIVLDGAEVEVRVLWREGSMPSPAELRALRLLIPALANEPLPALRSRVSVVPFRLGRMARPVAKQLRDRPTELGLVVEYQVVEPA
jgi:predicted RNA-binding Zn-ribbon protein involved in translation (DUF1610 family)